MSGELGDVDVLQGISPGSHVNDVAVLDLRLVPAEEIAKIEEIGDVDVLLLSDENRSALRGAHINDVKVMVTAGAEERTLISPSLEFSRSMLEAAPEGGRLLVIGNLFIKPDVPAELIAAKFDSLRVVGMVIACEAVFGSMLGKMQTSSGPVIALPNDTGHVVRNLSEIKVITEYLAELPDDTTYVNLAEARFSSDISHELLRQKIRAYYNTGHTKGPGALIGILRARSISDSGRFEVTDRNRD